MITTADQLLRDLLEDAVYRGEPDVASEWLTIAHPTCGKTALVEMWDQFREAVIGRDSLDDRRGRYAEYAEYFDLTDFDAPHPDDAVQVKADEADSLFVLLMRGPRIPALKAVA